jgi:hypothetical protein
VAAASFQQPKQKMDNGLLRKVEGNPDLKRDYENLLKHVPEDQRERAKVSIARTLVLSQSRGERREKPPWASEDSATFKRASRFSGDHSFADHRKAVSRLLDNCSCGPAAICGSLRTPDLVEVG